MRCTGLGVSCGEEPVVLLGTRRTLLKICFRREVGPLTGTWEWETGEMHADGHDVCRKCCQGPGRA